jgi:hypothetical protein
VATGRTTELTRGLRGKPETGNRTPRSDALLSTPRLFGFGGVEQVRANLGQDPPSRPSLHTKLALQLADIHIDRIGGVHRQNMIFMINRHRPASSASLPNTASTAHLNARQLARRSTTAR